MRELVAEGYPGTIALLEDAEATRGAARALSTPPGWQVCRSYRGRLALVAAAPTRVGVDLERCEPGLHPAAVCTPEEQRLVPDEATRARWWSSKEALAKALGDARAYEPSRLDAPARWPAGRSGRWRCQALALPEGYVGFVVWEVPERHVP